MIMQNNLLKQKLEALLFGGLFLFSCQSPTEQSASKEAETNHTQEIEAYYVQMMDSCTHYLHLIDTSQSKSKNQQIFLAARKWYKYAEPIIIAYDHENYKTINGPNLLKVEIDDYTDIKKIKPNSFQVLEEILFAVGEYDRETLQRSSDFLKARVPFMAENHMIKEQTDRHHLKMIRDVIVNIATKGLTGFDSPALSQSLIEAAYNYESLAKILAIYKNSFTDETIYQAWMAELDSAKATLLGGKFDDFDRYAFIKTHTKRQLELIKQTAKDFQLELTANEALNQYATTIFSQEFYNISDFTPPQRQISRESIALGKKLFNDKQLSLNGKLSCASCHHEDKAFTDGLTKAKGNDDGELLRNTPTLTYAVYQRKFFYDAVSTSLEGQIINVIGNPKEFHTNFEAMEKEVMNNSAYQSAFNELYKGKTNARNIRNAISDYVRSLAPFNSKFDRNINGEENSLSKLERKGFNLFMGKASCGTCHFAPSFFGTVPPSYDETELENLGVPATASFNNPDLDQDLGAYEPFKVDERKFFFKTSTVRNIAMTAPYMHNGVYETLEEVIEFYNVGGGAGMGIDNPYQTLPADSLHLSELEKQALIAFLNSLTDSVYQSEPLEKELKAALR